MAEVDKEPCFVPQQIEVVDGPIADALIAGSRAVTR